MAWNFKTPLEEMSYDQLMDELAEFMVSDDPECNLDSEELRKLLARLEEICPIPDLVTTEESLAAFQKKYGALIEELSKNDQ